MLPAAFINYQLGFKGSVTGLVNDIFSMGCSSPIALLSYPADCAGSVLWLERAVCLCCSTFGWRHLRHIKSLSLSLIRLEVVEAIYLIQGKPRREKKKKKKRLHLTNYSALKATRVGENKCVVPCTTRLLITLLSLIPIMSGGGLSSDSVTAMIAGLVFIRNYHWTGYKHTRTQPSRTFDHLHKQTQAHLCHLGLQS